MTLQIIFGLAVFLLAGTVKGLVGLGLPTITIALTSLVLPLPEAIALISLPTIVTNVWQAAVGGKFRIILRRQWPLIVPLAIALYLTMWLVGQKGPNWAFLVLAAVLILYSGLGLLRIRLHIHADLEKPLAPVIGVVSGFIAGAGRRARRAADALPAGARHQADRAGANPGRRAVRHVGHAHRSRCSSSACSTGRAPSCRRRRWCRRSPACGWASRSACACRSSSSAWPCSGRCC